MLQEYQELDSNIKNGSLKYYKIGQMYKVKRNFRENQETKKKKIRTETQK